MAYPDCSLLQNWLHPEVSGIGAGIDSFYEYALKWYILSGKSCGIDSIYHVLMFGKGEVEFLDVFQEAYAALMRYSRSSDGFWVSGMLYYSYTLTNANVSTVPCYERFHCT